MSKKNAWFVLVQKVFCVQVQATADKRKSVLSRGFLVIKAVVKRVECVWFTQWLQTPLWPIGLCRHMTASVHQSPCATMCVYFGWFGLEHWVIWGLAALFMLNLVKIHDKWGFCVCREPQGLGCQYSSRSRGYCIFSVVIETFCVFLLLPCHNCAVWGGKSLLERKCHDSRFVSGVRAVLAQQRVLWALCCVSNNASLASAPAPAQFPESCFLFRDPNPACLSAAASGCLLCFPPALL